MVTINASTPNFLQAGSPSCHREIIGKMDLLTPDRQTPDDGTVQ